MKGITTVNKHRLGFNPFLLYHGQIVEFCGITTHDTNMMEGEKDHRDQHLNSDEFFNDHF